MTRKLISIHATSIKETGSWFRTWRFCLQKIWYLNCAYMQTCCYNNRKWSCPLMALACVKRDNWEANCHTDKTRKTVTYEMKSNVSIPLPFIYATQQVKPTCFLNLKTLKGTKRGATSPMPTAVWNLSYFTVTRHWTTSRHTRAVFWADRGRRMVSQPQYILFGSSN